MNFDHAICDFMVKIACKQNHKGNRSKQKKVSVTFSSCQSPRHPNISCCLILICLRPVAYLQTVSLICLLYNFFFFLGQHPVYVSSAYNTNIRHTRFHPKGSLSFVKQRAVASGVVLSFLEMAI